MLMTIIWLDKHLANKSSNWRQAMWKTTLKSGYWLALAFLITASAIMAMDIDSRHDRVQGKVIILSYM
ncbi:MAG: hypothetical protein OEL78_06445 [Hyphomicrobiales bacterium]|nr:hypothetical protein [Hyphomicrobiales bacterium]